MRDEFRFPIVSDRYRIVIKDKSYAEPRSLLVDARYSRTLSVISIFRVDCAYAAVHKCATTRERESERSVALNPREMSISDGDDRFMRARALRSAGRAIISLS